MPLENDDNASASSTEETLDAAGQPLDLEQDGQASGADSSDAQGDNEGRGTLDIVKDVVGQRTEGQAAGSPPDGQKQGDGAEQEGQSKEPDDEKFSDVPFHKHPRFQQLLKQRDDYKVGAERYQNVQNFMDEHGIAAEEAANAYSFMAMVKRGDYVQAWELIKPTVQQLLVAAGEVLPDDLKQKVAAGELTDDAARQIAKEKAKAESATAARSFDQKRQERSQTQNAGKALVTTANDWASAKRKSDPNFAAKEPLLMKEVAWLIQSEGKPTTPEGVKAQLDKAYKAVVLPAARTATGQFQRQAPKVKDGLPGRRPTSGGGAPPNARPQAPATMLQRIQQEVAKRAG